MFQLLDKVVENREILIINDRHEQNVALITESDLLSLVKIVYT
ncbi:hypothetical protein GM3708_3442 [Geminocystis sp. NIES-3708]|nr:hypothetical protein [Geminocystis sp. NIES-3708]BAQ63036.1 hypothetical protein GM3708_3442 [Geminocystis sp. NIES-3708]